MAADIRAVGPGKLAVFGQGIADIGQSLLQNELAKQRLNEERKLQLEPAFIQKIVGHPLQADDLIKAAAMMGLDLSSLKPSDQDIYQQVGAGIQAAKDPTQVPTESGILSAIQQARPEAINPTLGVSPSPSVFAGDTGKFTLPSTEFGPAQRPEIQSLIDAATAKKQDLLDSLQAKSAATTGGRITTEHKFAPITNADAANRAGKVLQTQIDTQANNLPNLEKIERGKNAAGAAGRLDIELNPDVIKAQAKAGAAKTKASAQAQQDVLYDPANVLKRLDFTTRQAKATAQAQNDVKQAAAIKDSETQAAGALNILNKIQGLWNHVKTDDPTAIAGRGASRAAHTLQFTDPRAAELDRQVDSFAIQLIRSWGVTGRVTQYELDSVKAALPTSTTRASVGDPLIHTVQDQIAISPIIRGMNGSAIQKIQAAQELSQRLGEFREHGTWNGQKVPQGVQFVVDPTTGLKVYLPQQ